MEWLIIIGIAFFVISRFGGSKSPKSAQLVVATSRGPTTGDPDFAGALSAWRKQIAAQFDPGRWIPLSTAEEIAAGQPMPIWKGSSWANPVGKSNATDLIKVEIKKHNEGFRARQRLARKHFFDTVEKNPLTHEQVDACICMDDNVMVVAAAGSGKTSTMVAKAGYVLSEGLAQADQILMLAFNSAAAKELGERVANRLKDVPGIEGISSQTFHAFGLAVIGAAHRAKASPRSLGG
jgi:DNA helicase-4